MSECSGVPQEFRKQDVMKTELLKMPLRFGTGEQKMELNAEQIKKALDSFHKRILETDLAEKIYETEIVAIIDALALINSQEQSIKELTEENEEKDETIAGLIGTIKDAYGFAVREMKARLDKNLIAIKDHTGKIGLVVLDSDIDQIAKEMLEGE